MVSALLFCACSNKPQKDFLIIDPVYDDDYRLVYNGKKYDLTFATMTEETNESGKKIYTVTHYGKASAGEDAEPVCVCEYSFDAYPDKSSLLSCKVFNLTDKEIEGFGEEHYFFYDSFVETDYIWIEQRITSTSQTVFFLSFVTFFPDKDGWRYEQL